MALNYFTPDYAVSVHDKILSISGGRIGIKDLNMIISPLAHITNDDYYPSLEEKLTHIVFSFNKFHGFSDGNKRSSIALGAFFLIVNGLDVFVDKFIVEMENITVAVAQDIIDKPMLQRIITSVINDEDFPEDLKLDIFDALSWVVQDDNEYEAMGPGFFTNLF